MNLDAKLEAFDEVLAAIADRDERAADDGLPTTPISAAQLVRIAAAIRLAGRTLLSLPSAAKASGIRADLLRLLADRCHMPHARELGLYFVELRDIPSPEAIAVALSSPKPRGPHAPGRLARAVQLDSLELLAIAARLIVERGRRRRARAEAKTPPAPDTEHQTQHAGGRPSRSGSFPSASPNGAPPDCGAKAR